MEGPMPAAAKCLRFLSSIAVVVATALAVRPAQAAPSERPLVVAVTEADIEAIVKAVGGGDVITFPLFSGCILRDGLEVDASVRDRLGRADAVIWTGFFNESRAIHSWLESVPPEGRAALARPVWLDVSAGSKRVNVPVSACDGYVDLQFMPGDPFFWLNPENGAVIAANVAEGLARLRPERSERYAASAATFGRDLAVRIERWKAELAPLAGLRVFSVQCGWQNFAQLGGPKLMSCRQGPATQRSPEALAAQLAGLELDVILVDPNAPPAYAEACRQRTGAEVVLVPSSLAALPGATSYTALFDNFVAALKGTAAASRAGRPRPGKD